jgi:hypothetical protein
MNFNRETIQQAERRLHAAEGQAKSLALRVSELKTQQAQVVLHPPFKYSSHPSCLCINKKKRVIAR